MTLPRPQVFSSAGDDGLCKVWDRRTLSETNPTPVGIFAGHKDGITYMDVKVDIALAEFNSHHVLYICNTLNVHMHGTHKYMHTHTHMHGTHKHMHTHTHMHTRTRTHTHTHTQDDGRYLITNSKDQSIKLWDMRRFSPKEGEQATLVRVAQQDWDYHCQEVPKRSTVLRTIGRDLERASGCCCRSA